MKRKKQSDESGLPWGMVNLRYSQVSLTIAYTDDGAQRLTGAVESSGSSFACSYDLAGNRTGVTVDGAAVFTNTYDAPDQVVGWTYDAAGNLTSDAAGGRM
jgi:YD repeat-containing protein